VRLSFIANGQLHTQFREIQARNGLSSQNESRLFFGLPPKHTVTKVNIEWCGKKAAQELELKTNRYHKVIQGEVRALSGI
jgi:hypothetical protein